MREWIKVYCKFCNKLFPEDYGYFPPSCDCSGYIKSHDVWLQEVKSSPDYEEPLEEGEYERKYPQTYLGERIVSDKDGSHRIALEARKYQDGEGLCVSLPFSHDDGNNNDDDDLSGLCFDFSKEDAKQLFDMLKEYLEM